MINRSTGCILTCLFILTIATKMQGEEFYHIPEEKNDGWQISTLQKEGFNQEIISKLLRKINNRAFKNIHSIIIAKNNRIVLDEFYKKKLSYIDKGLNSDIELHAAMSVTKSIFSLLMGIAIDQGIVKSVNEKVLSFFPEYGPLQNWPLEKQNLTIKNFLTMRHGLAWNEIKYNYDDERNSFYKISQQNDWVKATLDLDLVNKPGVDFAYSSGISHVVAALIARASGRPIEDFADKFLYKPLEIKKTAFYRAPDGRADDVFLTTRAMAKIGQLIINNGKWNGKRIVSASWIKQSTKIYYDDPDEDCFDYSYFWWRYNFKTGGKNLKAVIAWGWGGQFIFVFPELDMVVVITEGNYYHPKREEQAIEMIADYILPAISE